MSTEIEKVCIKGCFRAVPSWMATEATLFRVSHINPQLVSVSLPVTLFRKITLLSSPSSSSLSPCRHHRQRAHMEAEHGGACTGRGGGR